MNNGSSIRLSKQTKSNPQGEEESDQHYLGRMVELSKQEVKEAADLGTRIHDAIDQSFDGFPIAEELLPYVNPVLDYIEASKFFDIEREAILVSNLHGYGGRVDMIAKQGNHKIVIDFKLERLRRIKRLLLMSSNRCRLQPMLILGLEILIKCSVRTFTYQQPKWEEQR